MILPSTTNPDRYLDRSKDRPCISPSTAVICIMERKNKFIKFKEIITYTWVSTKNSIGLGSSLRIIAYNKKCFQLSIFIKKQPIKNGC
jgi:hypothetical protein